MGLISDLALGWKRSIIILSGHSARRQSIKRSMKYLRASYIAKIFHGPRSVKPAKWWTRILVIIKQPLSLLVAYVLRAAHTYIHTCIHHDDKVPHRPDEVSINHLWNVGQLLLDYTALYPRRLSSSLSPPWESESHFFRYGYSVNKNKQI
jgi:hypothetical protein